MQDLGKLLSKSNIHTAIDHVEGAHPRLNAATRYALHYAGKLYPPKEIARIAVRLDDTLPADKHTAYTIQGGPEKINKWFTRLGFNITYKDGSPIPKRNSENRITRLCFNLMNWTEPTGPSGKSNEGHEGTYGYGHEEWLFDLSRLIDGWHYGFVEAFRDKTDSYEAEPLNLRFYTIDGRDQKRYWAGRITGLEVIGPEEAIKIKQIYQQKGWLERMNQQLITIQRTIEGVEPTGFSNYHNLQLFNVRFRPENLDRSSVGRSIPMTSRIMGWQRYNLNHERLELLAGVPVIPTPGPPPAEPEAPRSSTVYIPSGEPVEMQFIHEAMSIGLAQLLRAHYREGARVVREDLIGFDAREVDIVVKKGSETIFYEIKTAPTLPMAIRAALSQLMEYAHWTEEIRADHWIIVTPPQIDITAAELYLRHLRSIYELPVHLQTFDNESRTLTRLLPRSAFPGRDGEVYFL